MRRSAIRRGGWLAASLLLGLGSPASATWSIVIADSETREVAVGTVTCLTSYDLLAIVPVVVVDRGVAAVQASGDFGGTRRPIIFQHLIDGTSPAEILSILAGVSGHQSRQYGIADTQGRMITFTGGSTIQWAGGVTGSAGTMVYAVQGNILAGGCVVPAIEAAILNTGGDIPSRLMAGMQAARLAGGDGRCSCSPSFPTNCGCPPIMFVKAGHIGGMVVARTGDTDDPVCSASGCADGDYFMRLNVVYQSSGATDPVIQLQTAFDNWRNNHNGRPDAIHSLTHFEPARMPPTGAAQGSLEITLLDWRDEPIDFQVQSLTVTHASDSAGISAIGAVTDHGDGTLSVAISAGTAVGTDRFTVTVDDGIRPVILLPLPELRYAALGDYDDDGDVDIGDFGEVAGCLTAPAGGLPDPDCGVFDFDWDGDVDLIDFRVFQGAFTGG